MTSYKTKSIHKIRPTRIFKYPVETLEELEERYKIKKTLMRGMSFEDQKLYFVESDAVIDTRVAVNKNDGSLLILTAFMNKG